MSIVIVLKIALAPYRLARPDRIAIRGEPLN
jgi:hypothetical protein